jgi:hypothetical protein
MYSEVSLNLTKNLILYSIEENMSEGDKLKTVLLSFSFFGEHGEAYLTLQKVEENIPSFAMTEITSELSDSFNELLEDEEVFEQIRKSVLLFSKEFTEEYNS